jgi:hypothetical protein
VEDRPTAASVKVLISDALSGERREAGAALEALAAGLRAEQQQQLLGLKELAAAMQEAAQQTEELKQEQVGCQGLPGCMCRLCAPAGHSHAWQPHTRLWIVVFAGCHPVQTCH